MANDGFISTKFDLNSDQIDRDLALVIRHHFDDVLVKEQISTNYWQLKSNDDKFFDIIDIIKISKRKISLRHPHVDMFQWMHHRVIDELAYKWKGIISDEGVSEKWKPTMKYKTYQNWMLHMNFCSTFKKDPGIALQYVIPILMSVPKKWRKTFGINEEELKTMEVIHS